MNTVILLVHYISCEGNKRWLPVKVNEDYNENDIISKLFENYGYDDAPSQFLYIEHGYNEFPEDWTNSL